MKHVKQKIIKLTLHIYILYTRSRKFRQKKRKVSEYFKWKVVKSTLRKQYFYRKGLLIVLQTTEILVFLIVSLFFLSLLFFFNHLAVSCSQIFFWNYLYLLVPNCSQSSLVHYDIMILSKMYPKILHSDHHGCQELNKTIEVKQSFVFYMYIYMHT